MKGIYEGEGRKEKEGEGYRLAVLPNWIAVEHVGLASFGMAAGSAKSEESVYLQTWITHSTSTLYHKKNPSSLSKSDYQLPPYSRFFKLMGIQRRFDVFGRKYLIFELVCNLFFTSKLFGRRAALFAAISHRACAGSAILR